MTAPEKAQAGLRMIEEAVLELIRDNGPLRPFEVSDALGLRWQTGEGEQSAGSVGIGYNIMQAMAADTGPLVKDPGSCSTYSLKLKSTQS